MSATRAGARLLIYSQDGLGLGHLRRTTLLAAEFAAEPGSSVLTICDSPLGQFFSTASGHEHLKLPSIRKRGPGDWQPVSLSMPFTDVLAVRKEIIRAAALTFRPDVLLVDHMPHGAMGELVPTLESLQRRQVRMVLGLRDILDAPATIRRRWHLEGLRGRGAPLRRRPRLRFARRVRRRGPLRWPAAISSRLRYCGYVCSRHP